MKFFNVLGVCFIKISFIVYCSGEGSFEKVLNDYKPEIDLPSDEILYLKDIPFKNLKAAVQRSKDLVEYKAKNNEYKAKNNALNLETENYRLSCTFTKGRRINEDLFKNISNYERVEYGKKLTRLFNEGYNLIKSGTVKTPEDLSNYPFVDPRLWEKIEASYYYHWVQYFIKCTHKHAKNLKQFLDQKKVSYFEFGWAMSKTYTVFCDYVHTRTQSAKMMDTETGFQQLIYLDLIKKHNNWILTTRDLEYLDYAAEFTGNFKISNFEWFDKTKKLAIPILKSGNPVLITKCPAIIQDDKYAVKMPTKN